MQLWWSSVGWWQTLRRGGAHGTAGWPAKATAGARMHCLPQSAACSWPASRMLSESKVYSPWGKHGNSFCDLRNSTPNPAKARWSLRQDHLQAHLQRPLTFHIPIGKQAGMDRYALKFKNSDRISLSMLRWQRLWIVAPDHWSNAQSLHVYFLQLFSLNHSCYVILQICPPSLLWTPEVLWNFI